MTGYCRCGVFLLIGVSSFSRMAFGQFNFTYDSEERRWNLRNDVAEASFRLDPEGHFLFEQMHSLRNSDGWTARNGGVTPVQVQLAGETFDGNTTYRLVLQTQRPIPRGGYRTSI